MINGEKCAKEEFFLDHFFTHLNWKQRFNLQISIFQSKLRKVWTRNASHMDTLQVQRSEDTFRDRG